MRNNNDIYYLISKSVLGTITDEEQSRLKEWIGADASRQKLVEKWSSSAFFVQKKKVYDAIDTEYYWNDFEKRNGKLKNRMLQFKQIARYAAVLLLLLGSGFFVFRFGKTAQKEKVNSSFYPKGYQAILTLESGEEVFLDSLPIRKAVIPEYINLKNGEVCYNQQQTEESNHVAIAYNQLTVPIGAEYRLILSDGTHVHLNSGSCLRYPSQFASDKREVFLKGEGWFEVEKDSTCPFIVSTREVQICVYGTKFNVNTLKAEHLETVLVEGKIGVKVNSMDEEVVLHPSELFSYDRTTKQGVVSTVDVAPYVAWVDGLFIFKAERLSDLMERLSLWYGLDVFYSNEELKDIRFTGYIERYEDVSVILKAIEKTLAVHYSINNKTIILSR